MPFTSPTWTVLELTGMGIVPYSTRKASQTLDPIDAAAANLYRDVNGILRATGGTAFQKYKSTISCTDQRPFANDGVWPGQLVTVKCIQHLAYLSETGGSDRNEVAGSAFTEGDWTFYRPEIDMMVMRFAIQTDEYGGEVGWTLELEEI